MHEIGEESPDIINKIHNYIEKITGKENKLNNALEEPNNIISVKNIKLTKNIKRNKTKKFYILSNGKQHKIEIEVRK